MNWEIRSKPNSRKCIQGGQRFLNTDSSKCQTLLAPAQERRKECGLWFWVFQQFLGKPTYSYGCGISKGVLVGISLPIMGMGQDSTLRSIVCRPKLFPITFIEPNMNLRRWKSFGKMITVNFRCLLNYQENCSCVFSFFLPT